MNDLTAFIRAYSRAVADVLKTTVNNTFKSFADLNAGWKYNPNASTTVPTKTGEVFNDYEDNVASADYSHAEGNVTKATGKASHAQNIGTTASGEASTAMGTGSTASGSNSIAGGNQTTALGTNSVAFGDTTHANGNNSFTMGYFLEANSQNQVVFGQYNDNNPSNILEIGNGSSAQRKNIFSITTEGKTIGGVNNLNKGTDSAQTLTPKGYVDEQIDRLDKNVWLGYIDITTEQYHDTSGGTNSIYTLLTNAVKTFTVDTNPPDGRTPKNGDQITVNITNKKESDPQYPEIWMYRDPDPKENESDADNTPGKWLFFSSVQPLLNASKTVKGLVEIGQNLIVDQGVVDVPSASTSMLGVVKLSDSIQLNDTQQLIMIWNDWGTTPTPAEPYQAEMTEESYEGGLKYTLNIIPNVVYKAEYHSEIEVQGGYFVYESVQPDEYGRYVIQVTSHIVNFLVPSTISDWSVWIYPKN